MTRAYSESYLSDAKDRLSQFFDYLIKDCGMKADWVASIFLSSGYAEQFERGNPAILAGMSGIELARVVVEATYKKKSCRSRVIPKGFLLSIGLAGRWQSISGTAECASRISSSA